MQIIRSFIFNILFISITLLISVIFLPLVFLPKKYIFIVGKAWAKMSLFLLKYILNIEVIVRGRENLPAKEGFIIASKHQSVIETIVFWDIFSKPVYILKRELLLLPLYGLYLFKMSMIYIDRKAGAMALKSMLKQAKEIIKSRDAIIIFPEGTRTKPNVRIAYQPGVAALYSSLKVPVVPVALNTGVFWPKGAFTKLSGQCIIEFLEPLPQDLSKDEFLYHLSEKVERKSKELL